MNWLIFDLTPHQHLPEYLRAIIAYWSAQDLAGTLTLLVRHTLPRDHPDLVAQVQAAPRANIQFVALTKEERYKRRAFGESADGQTISFAELLQGTPVDNVTQYEWELFCRYAEQLDAYRAFIVYLDRYVPLLAAGAEPPVPLAGICFAPVFHYPLFGDSLTTAALNPGISQREKFMLTRALRASRLETLFFLDPFVVPEAQKLPQGHKAQFIADPVTITPVPEERVQALRAELGIAPQRHVFLLFGHLGLRKGLKELFEALEHLAAEGQDELLARMCIVFAGQASPTLQSHLQDHIQVLAATAPVQLIARCEYVSSADAAAFFQLADTVLAPYPMHNGMSGILLLAAAFQKPLLTGSYGLVGEMTRRYRLGLAVDVTQPAQFAGALTRLMQEDAATLCDFEQMRELAAAHAPEKFASTIFMTPRNANL